MFAQAKTIEAMVREHPFFLTMDAAYLPVVCKGARIVELAPDEILFQIGEPANRFFLLENGTVALEARTESGRVVEVKELKGGDVLGWSWLVQPFCWHLQARALEASTAIMLDGAHLLVACEEDYRFGYVLMKRVAQLMAQRLNALRQRLVDECERTSHEEFQTH